jgi:hypothetical protein
MQVNEERHIGGSSPDGRTGSQRVSPLETKRSGAVNNLRCGTAACWGGLLDAWPPILRDGPVVGNHSCRMFLVHAYTECFGVAKLLGGV